MKRAPSRFTGRRPLVAAALALVSVLSAVGCATVPSDRSSDRSSAHRDSSVAPSAADRRTAERVDPTGYLPAASEASLFIDYGVFPEGRNLLLSALSVSDVSEPDGNPPSPEGDLAPGTDESGTAADEDVKRWLRRVLDATDRIYVTLGGGSDGSGRDGQGDDDSSNTGATGDSADPAGSGGFSALLEGEYPVLVLRLGAFLSRDLRRKPGAYPIFTLPDGELEIAFLSRNVILVGTEPVASRIGAERSGVDVEPNGTDGDGTTRSPDTSPATGEEDRFEAILRPDVACAGNATTVPAGVLVLDRTEILLPYLETDELPGMFRRAFSVHDVRFEMWKRDGAGRAYDGGTPGDARYSLEVRIRCESSVQARIVEVLVRNIVASPSDGAKHPAEIRREENLVFVEGMFFDSSALFGIIERVIRNGTWTGR